jgi:VCBS repeat-containing protein
VFHGETVTAIDVHNYSRGGSDPLFGANQPATNNGDDRRIDQTTAVRDYVQGLLAADPDAHVAVMGDFNGYYYEQTLTLLEANGDLYNLARTLSPEERYSYIFEGNAQQIDNLLVSQSLRDGAVFDNVHLNTGQAAIDQPTDHDAILALLSINTAPVATLDGVFTVAEDAVLTVDAAHGVLANDSDVNSDVLTAVLDQGPTLWPWCSTPTARSSTRPTPTTTAADSFTYTAHDAFGGVSGVVTVQLGVEAVNDAPVGTADAASVAEDASILVDVLANDTRCRPGRPDHRRPVGRPVGPGRLDLLENGQVRYVADADGFDQLAAGQSVVDSFTYTASDGHGGFTAPITVSVTVGEAGDNRSLSGGLLAGQQLHRHGGQGHHLYRRAARRRDRRRRRGRHAERAGRLRHAQRRRGRRLPGWRAGRRLPARRGRRRPDRLRRGRLCDRRRGGPRHPDPERRRDRQPGQPVDQPGRRAAPMSRASRTSTPRARRPA